MEFVNGKDDISCLKPPTSNCVWYTSTVGWNCNLQPRRPSGRIYIYNWSFLAIRQRFRIIRIKKFLKINKFLTHIILCFFPFKHHLRWGKNLKQHMKKGVENPTKLGKIRPPETQFPPAVLTKLLRLCSDKPGPRLVDQWMFSNIKQLDLYTCLC